MDRWVPYLLTLAPVLLLALVLYIAINAYLGERRDYVRTFPAEISRHPEQTGILGLTEIAFAMPGGFLLAAWYAPPHQTRAAVILVHGVSAERSSLLFETRMLASAGFGVLALDLPGQGASEGRIEWGIPERAAISSAVDWLTHRDEVDARRIGAYGLSMGAYVLAQAAVLDQRISAVALTSTPNEVVEFNWLATSRWGWISQYPAYWALRNAGTPRDLAPKDIMGRIAPRSLLLIQGERDVLVPPWMAEQLFAAAGDPKELFLVKGAAHSDFSTAAPVEYSRRLTDFYRRALVTTA